MATEITAFFNIMKDNLINIKAICKLCQISRGTFYKRYAPLLKRMPHTEFGAFYDKRDVINVHNGIITTDKHKVMDKCSKRGMRLYLRNNYLS